MPYDFYFNKMKRVISRLNFLFLPSSPCCCKCKRTYSTILLDRYYEGKDYCTIQSYTTVYINWLFCRRMYTKVSTLAVVHVYVKEKIAVLVNQLIRNLRFSFYRMIRVIFLKEKGFWQWNIEIQFYLCFSEMHFTLFYFESR